MEMETEYDLNVTISLMREILINRKKSRVVLGFFWIICMIILTIIAIILLQFQSTTILRTIIIYLSIPLFFLVLLYYIYILTHTVPALVINEKGIVNNAAFGAVGMIEWHEIKSIYIDTMDIGINGSHSDQDFITIEVKNLKEFREKLPLWKQYWISFCLATNYPAVYIPTQFLVKNRTTILKEIQSFHPELIKHPQTNHIQVNV
jgi:hypothetical protein